MGRIKFSLSSGIAHVFALLLLLLPPAAFSQTELGSVDDLTVLGVDGTAPDPDTEIKGFTVFGATQSAYTGITPAAGGVVVNGVLAVSSGAYFVGNSTFTGAGRIFINDGSAGQVLRKGAAGALSWDDVTAVGDNLGGHNASQRLNLAGNQIIGVSSLTVLAPEALPSSLWVSTSPLTPHLYVSTTGRIGFATGTPQARLDMVAAGAGDNDYLHIWRNNAGVIVASMTSTGKIFADVSGAAGGDDLGSHVAFKDLDMSSKGILGVSTISASGIYISTYGEVQTVGMGRGTVAGSARGIGAVDLQVNRSAAGQAATGGYSVIGGGQQNAAAGLYAVVPGGSQNTAANQYSVVGGGVGNNASGAPSTVPGGQSNTASGNYSFAAGFAALASAAGAFTWADSAGVPADNAVADRTWFKTRGGFLVTGSTSTALSATVDRGLLVTGNGMVGIATGAPQAALDVVPAGSAQTDMGQIWRDSAGVIVGSMSAAGYLRAVKLIGDGSGLSGLPSTLSGGQAPHVPYWTAANTLGNSNLSQDSGGLTVMGTTLTVQGNAFSVGGSTLAVKDGNVGIGTTNPISGKLQVEGGSADNATGIYGYTNSNGGASIYGVQDNSGGKALYGRSAAGWAGYFDGKTYFNGNVGIGTASPGQKFEVKGAATAGVVTNVSDFASNGLRLTQNDSTDGDVAITYVNTGGSAISMGRSNWKTHIAFYTNPQATQVGGAMREVARITEDGRLAIGANSALAHLDVVSSNPNLVHLGPALGDSDGGYSIVNLSGDYNTLAGAQYDGGGYYGRTNSSSMIRQDASGNIRFFSNTGVSGGYFTPTERMVIANNGNVGIGTTAPGTKLQVNNNSVYGSLVSDVGDVLIKTRGSYGLGDVAGLTIVHGSNSDAVTNYMPSIRLDNVYGNSGAILANMGTGKILFQGYDGSNFIPAASIVTSHASGFSTNAGYAHMMFSTNNGNSSPTERMRITSAGNVGIGTANPGHGLEVVQNDPASASVVFSNSGTGSSGVEIRSAGTYAYLDFSTGSTSNVGGGAPDATARIWQQGDSLKFGIPVDQPKLTILQNGNVGIGTTAPNDALHVYRDYDSDGSIGANASTIFIDGAAGKDAWLGWGTAGAAKMVAGIDNGSNSVQFWGYNGGWGAGPVLTLGTNGNVGIGTTGPLMKLQINSIGGLDSQNSAETVWKNNVYYSGTDKWLTGSGKAAQIIQDGTGIHFWVSNDASTGAGNTVTDWGEKVRIQSDGKVGIGNNNPGYTLTVNGTAWVTSGAWSGSDRRWKKDVAPLTGSLGKVLALQGVGYNWRTEEFPELKFSTAPQVGLIAQDTEKIVPEAVTTGEDGYKGISYEKLVPVLIEAVKEQQREIESLRSRLDKMGAAAR